MERRLLVYRMIIQGGHFSGALLARATELHPSLRFTLEWCQPTVGCGVSRGHDGIYLGGWKVGTSELSDMSVLARYERDVVERLLLEYDLSRKWSMEVGDT
jgi:hypothetical protein